MLICINLKFDFFVKKKKKKGVKNVILKINSQTLYFMNRKKKENEREKEKDVK